MGIFSKWITTIPEATVRLDELHCDATANALNDAKTGSASLLEFLQERQLILVDDTHEIERVREQVEKSGIVPMMIETCALINNLAGRTIVDSHSFLPSIPTLCCFIFVEDGTEYFIRLELQGTIPTLIFAERKCRDTVNNDFVRWAHRLADIQPVTITVKLVHEFQDISVSVAQVRKWFIYLISCMDGSRTPSF
jgi:hypothetical protein